MDFHTLIGLAGVVAYMVSYGALQLELLDGNGVIYSVLNVLAAALVLVSLTADFNLASALIQIIWIIIGTVGLALRAFRKRTRQVSAQLAELDPASYPDTNRMRVPVVTAHAAATTIQLDADELSAIVG